MRMCLIDHLPTANVSLWSFKNPCSDAILRNFATIVDGAGEWGDVHLAIALIAVALLALAILLMVAMQHPPKR